MGNARVVTSARTTAHGLFQHKRLHSRSHATPQQVGVQDAAGTTRDPPVIRRSLPELASAPGTTRQRAQSPSAAPSRAAHRGSRSAADPLCCLYDRTAHSHGTHPGRPQKLGAAAGRADGPWPRTACLANAQPRRSTSLRIRVRASGRPSASTVDSVMAWRRRRPASPEPTVDTVLRGHYHPEIVKFPNYGGHGSADWRKLEATIELDSPAHRNITTGKEKPCASNGNQRLSSLPYSPALWER